MKVAVAVRRQRGLSSPKATALTGRVGAVPLETLPIVRGA